MASTVSPPRLLRFKTATLTAFGLRRSGVWNAETASQKIEHFGLMFGALVASPDGEIRGHGAELASLSFAHLLFPRVWDWYLSWREARRGFYTRWEVTGWLRQTPRMGDHLAPIPGLVDEDEIAAAHADWHAACDAMHAHGRHRTRELKRVKSLGMLAPFVEGWPRHAEGPDRVPRHVAVRSSGTSGGVSFGS